MLPGRNISNERTTDGGIKVEKVEKSDNIGSPGEDKSLDGSISTASSTSHTIPPSTGPTTQPPAAKRQRCNSSLGDDDMDQEPTK